MPTFDTPEPITATVDLPIGEIRVIASARSDTTVDVRSAASDRAQAEAVRVELVGRELRVTGPPLGLRQLLPKTPGRTLEIEIALPAGSALSAQTGYGGVQAEGRLDACDIRTRYGDVRIEDAASAEITTSFGQVRVTGDIDGHADLTADHGGVRVRRVGGAAVLRSKHGGIRADRLAGEARLTGTHGDIEVDVADADVRVRTAHGGVRLGRVARGEISLTNTHGRLEIGIAPTSAAWLDLDTGGRVSNDLTAQDDPAGFAETVSVHARSREGAIVIRRA